VNEGKLHGRVLITGAGGPAAVSVIRAVADEALMIFAADIDPLAAGLYLVGADQRLIVPRGDDPTFVDFILDQCRLLRIDVLVPTVDSELLPLAEARTRFAEVGTELLACPEDTLRSCVDKWTLHQRCREAIPVPETRLIDEEFDPDSVPLPVVVKPRIGSGSRGVRLVSSRAELQAVDRDGSLLAQEELPGIEHSLDVLATTGGRVVAVVPRARLKIDSGIAVTARTVRSERLESFGGAVAERIGVTYVANVQVKEARDGHPRLLEVNPRFPGSMPLTVASGVDMPRLCLAAALGRPMAAERIGFREVAMARYFDECFFAVSDLARLQADAEALPQSRDSPE
jgi:carbamoyl-phosphate synthase large subunit